MLYTLRTKNLEIVLEPSKHKLLEIMRDENRNYPCGPLLSQSAP